MHVQSEQVVVSGCVHEGEILGIVCGQFDNGTILSRQRYAICMPKAARPRGPNAI